MVFACLMPALSPRPSTCVLHGGRRLHRTCDGDAQRVAAKKALSGCPKRRESSAPRPSSPPSSLDKFPSCLRGVFLPAADCASVANIGATMSSPRERKAKPRLQKEHMGTEIEQKNRHLTGEVRCLRSAFCACVGRESRRNDRRHIG